MSANGMQPSRSFIDLSLTGTFKNPKTMHGCTAPIPVYDFFPMKHYKKPMKNTIPFDIDKAKAGAKIVTNTGQEVRILTYEGRELSRPIIGTFMHADYEPGKGIGT